MSGTDSSTADRAPRRFRRRLTAAFVLVVAISTGFVVVTTFVLARENRTRTFHAASLDDARLALAVAPGELDEGNFERLRNWFQAHSDAELLVVRGDDVFASSPDLTVGDVPAGLAAPLSSEPIAVDVLVDEEPTIVVGAAGPGDARYFLFFSRAQLEDGLRELAQVLAGMWVVALAAAAAFGHLVARRTLRPVAETAQAAEAIAAGDLDARLASAERDEFGDLARSFNHMADEVQRLIEQLAEAATRERRFTADMAHDLRTPLTGLSASTAMLAEQLDDLPDTARGPARIVISDVERLCELVLELLELARLDASVDAPTINRLRLDASVDAVIASTDRRRNADIAVDVGDAVVLADPSRLRRILANIVDNAVIHGGGQIEVTAHAANSSVLIDVTDHGPGIPANELDVVFDRFAKSDRSRAAGGSGLGLAIARQHARSMGGDITAHNVTGAGAQFRICLPAGHS